jgi:hypothetical protein
MFSARLRLYPCLRLYLNLYLRLCLQHRTDRLLTVRWLGLLCHQRIELFIERFHLLFQQLDLLCLVIRSSALSECSFRTDRAANC